MKMIKRLMILVLGTLCFGVIALVGIGCMQERKPVTISSMSTVNGIVDYEFDTVPVDNIHLTAVNGVFNIQPRGTFSVEYILTPWYTTTIQVFYDVYPQSAATIDASGVGTVSANAVVGSSFAVTATADGVISNTVVFNVVKIPVTNLTLSLRDGDDDKLHVGKTKTFSPVITPAYASNTNLRYELTGNDLQWIENFDEATGEVTAKNEFQNFVANTTVTVTAISLDDESIRSYQTITLFIPTVNVSLSAATPLNGLDAYNRRLAVARSTSAETVTLKTLVNGVEILGANYVISAGQEYVKNGMVNSNGTFEIKKTADWFDEMKKPHAEIKIRVAYSDGFDEITIPIYVPIETISFNDSVPVNVENFRGYNLSANVAPSYATYIADHSTVLSYSLNGLSGDIATIDENGLLVLPKSLTSKGSTINFSAYLAEGWIGVDADALTHILHVVPVYATAFESVSIVKNNIDIDPVTNKVGHDDILQVNVIYTIDNVTEVSFNITETSSMLSTGSPYIFVTSLANMTADNPMLPVTVSYNAGGNIFSMNKTIIIYVAAEFATFNMTFERGTDYNLNNLVKINGHGYATDKSIEWGTNPTITPVNGQTGLTATITNGILRVSSQAHAGTTVDISYKVVDAGWQNKLFTVASLNNSMFRLEYDKDRGEYNAETYEYERDYTIDPTAPQLEEGYGVDLIVKYAGFTSAGMGAYNTYGVSYTITSISNNATLTHGGHSSLDDRFRLTAKNGESGNDNIITYVITVYDGYSTYTISTNVVGKPVSIFKRIQSEDISIANATVEMDERFEIENWDDSVTADLSDVVLNITGGVFDEEDKYKIISVPSGAFILVLSCTQTYNGQDVSWSKEFGFSVIDYKDQNGTSIRKVYKQSGKDTVIFGALVSTYAQTGWTISSNCKGTLIPFGSSYSNDANYTLYPYLPNKTSTIVFHVSGDNKEVSDSDIGVWESYKDCGLNIGELLNLGYNFTITVNVDIKEKNDGYQEIYCHAGNGSELWSKTDIEHGGSGVLNFGNGDWETHSYSFTLSTAQAATLSSFPKVRLVYGAHGGSGDSWVRGKSSIAITASK
jgi:hypothetical protein